VPYASLSGSDGEMGEDSAATQARVKLRGVAVRARTRTLAPSMPRTFRPSKSPARTRRSEENVECPLASAEAPPSADAAPVVPTPRLTSPEEKALASSRHQEVMARSKSPPRQLRPNAMPKIPGPACAEAGYQGHSLRRAVRHPMLFLSTTPGSGLLGMPQRNAGAAHAPAAPAASGRCPLPTSFHYRGADASSGALAEPPTPAAATRLQQLMRVGARLSVVVCLLACLLAYALPAILPALLPAGGTAPTALSVNSEPEPVPLPVTLENSTVSLGDNIG